MDRKTINKAIIDSHNRLLRECENHRDEITDMQELAIKYPNKSREDLERMQKLNMRINDANEFLYQEQYYFLNPNERPVEGIEYNEEIWADDERECDDEEYEMIRQELEDEDK